MKAYLVSSREPNVTELSGTPPVDQGEEYFKTSSLNNERRNRRVHDWLPFDHDNDEHPRPNRRVDEPPSAD